MMKPGGHGVIWKLLLDAGVFDWLAAQDRQAAVVRQIRCAAWRWLARRQRLKGVRHDALAQHTPSLHQTNPPVLFSPSSSRHPTRSNPMAGTDTTLLALAGAGFPARRAFGFASCERAVGAAEGMNVLAAERRLEPADAAAAAPASGASSGATPSGSEASSSSSSTDAADVQRYSWRYRVTNVEYTEFARLGLADASVDEASERSVFPANTNVLYVGLQVCWAVGLGCGAGGGLLLLEQALPADCRLHRRPGPKVLRARPSPACPRRTRAHRTPASAGGGAGGARQHGCGHHRRRAARHDPQHQQARVVR